jgi:hypothetical protein
MKKLNFLTLLFALVTAFSMQAQTTQGTLALGLRNFSPVLGEAGAILAPTNAFGIGFTTSTSKVDGTKDPQKIKNTTIGLSASAQYFIIDNLSAGISLNFLSQFSKEEGGTDNDDYKTTIFMAGPELRYYIPASSKTKIWIGGGGSFGSAKNEYDGQEAGEPIKLSRYGGGAGMAFFLNQHFSLDLGLGYSVFTTKKDELVFVKGLTKYEDSTGGVTLEIGFTAFL